MAGWNYTLQNNISKHIYNYMKVKHRNPKPYATRILNTSLRILTQLKVLLTRMDDMTSPRLTNTWEVLERALVMIWMERFYIPVPMIWPNILINFFVKKHSGCFLDASYKPPKKEQNLGHQGTCSPALSVSPPRLAVSKVIPSYTIHLAPSRTHFCGISSATLKAFKGNKAGGIPTATKTCKQINSIQ